MESISEESMTNKLEKTSLQDSQINIAKTKLMDNQNKISSIDHSKNTAEISNLESKHTKLGVGENPTSNTNGKSSLKSQDNITPTRRGRQIPPPKDTKASSFMDVQLKPPKRVAKAAKGPEDEIALKPVEKSEADSDLTSKQATVSYKTEHQDLSLDKDSVSKQTKLPSTQVEPTKTEESPATNGTAAAQPGQGPKFKRQFRKPPPKDIKEGDTFLSEGIKLKPPKRTKKIEEGPGAGVELKGFDKTKVDKIGPGEGPDLKQVRKTSDAKIPPKGKAELQKYEKGEKQIEEVEVCCVQNNYLDVFTEIIP